MIDLARSIRSTFVAFTEFSIAEKAGAYRSFCRKLSMFGRITRLHAVADKASKSHNS